MSLVNPAITVDIGILRDCYESLAMYCFGRYLIACLGMDIFYVKIDFFGHFHLMFRFRKVTQLTVLHKERIFALVLQLEKMWYLFIAILLFISKFLLTHTHTHAHVFLVGMTTEVWLLYIKGWCALFAKWSLKCPCTIKVLSEFCKA